MANQVARELARISNTIRGIGQDKRRFDIDKANIGLQGARQEYDIGRQRTQDARADELFEAGAPGRELKLAQDTRALSTYKAPVTMSQIISSPQAAEHFLHTRKGTGDKGIKGKTNIDLFLKDMGWTYDKDTEGMPIRTASGDYLKQGEFPADAYELWIKSNMNPKKRAEGQREAIDDKLRERQITPQQHAAALEKIMNYENSIPAQISENTTIIEGLRKFNAPWAKKRIDRLTQKNDALMAEDRAARLGLKRAGIKAGLGVKDTRSSDEKLMDYYAKHITKGDKAKAAEIFRTDKLMGRKLQAYISSVDALKDSDDWMDLSSKEQKEALDRLQIEFGIKAKPGMPEAPIGGRKVLLPGQKTDDNDPLGIR